MTLFNDASLKCNIIQIDENKAKYNANNANNINEKVNGATATTVIDPKEHMMYVIIYLFNSL